MVAERGESKRPEEGLKDLLILESGNAFSFGPLVIQGPLRTRSQLSPSVPASPAAEGWEIPYSYIN